MTKKHTSKLSLPFRSFLYAVLSVATELAAMFIVLIRIDETPIEGSPAGHLLMMFALGAAIVFVFFVLHRVLFGPLRGLGTGLRTHWSRTWAAYLLIPLGIIAERTGMTGSGAVVLLDRAWFEVMWNGPAMLALIPVLVDLLRLAAARIMAMVTR